MSEVAVRAVVAVLAIGLPIGLAWMRLRPRRARLGNVPEALGPFPTVLLFSSPSCPTCPPARELVSAACGSSLRELTWPTDTVFFHKLAVGTVPATFVVDGAGDVLERFDGVPDERRLRRTLGRAGLVR